MRSQAVRALLGLVIALIATIGPVGAAAFVPRETGRHAYAPDGDLSPAELRDLDARAAALERARLPTIVYVRRRTATHAETEQDARDLMTQWAVESRPGTKDGLVVVLNLRPDDPRHGEAALWAGQAHATTSLPPQELQRIYGETMRPLLTNGR